MCFAGGGRGSGAAWPPPEPRAFSTGSGSPPAGSGRHRITARRDFSRVYREGRRYSGDALVLYYLPTETPRRVGVTAGRRLGAAVIRNRAKRRLREALRRLESRLCSRGDIVVVGRSPAAEAPFVEIVAEMEALCAAGRLLRETRG